MLAQLLSPFSDFLDLFKSKPFDVAPYRIPGPKWPDAPVVKAEAKPIDKSFKHVGTVEIGRETISAYAQKFNVVDQDRREFEAQVKGAEREGVVPNAVPMLTMFDRAELRGVKQSDQAAAVVKPLWAAGKAQGDIIKQTGYSESLVKKCTMCFSRALKAEHPAPK